jgi:hypothetical protein
VTVFGVGFAMNGLRRGFLGHPTTANSTGKVSNLEENALH